MFKNSILDKRSGQTQSKNQGFTIVELLIVIVVIGILAAISIVAYNGIQGRANTSAVHSDLNNAKKKLEIYNIDHGKYPGSIAELTAADISISGKSSYEKREGYANFYYCLDIANNQFALSARVAGGNPISYYVTSSSGVTSHAGLISSGSTRITLGLGGASAAHGAYAASGMSTTGVASSWLNSSD